MLTAHQRLAIRSHLPEVERVYVREDRGPVDVSCIRLELRDGSTVVIYGLVEDGTRRCRRTRLVGDYSDRAEFEPIDAGMRDRLEVVVGRLTFGPEGDFGESPR